MYPQGIVQVESRVESRGQPQRKCISVFQLSSARILAQCVYILTTPVGAVTLIGGFGKTMICAVLMLQQ